MMDTGILLLTFSILFKTDILRTGAFLLILNGLILYNIIHKKCFFTWSVLDKKEIFNEKALLFMSFSSFVENILNDFAQKRGYRIEKQLETDFSDNFKKEDMVLKNKKLEIKQELSIIEMSDLLIKGLNFIVNYIINITGHPYMKKLLLYGRDNLYWKEREILDYYIFEKVTILKDSVSFRPEVPVDKRDIIKNIPFFSDRIDNLIDFFRMEFYLPGQDIIRQGEEGEKFYIITEGSVKVYTKDIAGSEREIATLARGDFFGEVALFENSLRTATVRAETPAELMVMTGKDFREAVKERFGEYQELHEESKDILRFIQKISLFDEFPRSQINFIAWRMRPVKCKEGEEIIKQGEQGRRYFYVIKSGEFLAELELENGEKKELSRMGTGEYFGEIALLLDIPRTATVRALTDGELYSLEEKDFDNILGKSLYSQKTLELIS